MKEKSPVVVNGNRRPNQSPPKVRIFDFKRPDKFSRQQIRSLYILHEQFCQFLTAHWTALLKMDVSLNLSSVDQLTYKEYIQSIPNPGVNAVLDMSPIKTHASMEIARPLVSTLLDRLFGGAGASSDERAPLTPVENRIMEGVFGQMMPSLREAWEILMPLTPSCLRIESNPVNVQIIPPDDMIALITAECSIGEVKGILNLCLPYLLLEPIIAKLSPAYWYSNPREQKAPGPLASFLPELPLETSLYYESPAKSLAEIQEIVEGKELEVDLQEWSCCLEAGGSVFYNLEPLEKNNFRIVEDSGFDLEAGNLQKKTPSELERFTSRMEENMNLLASRVETRMRSLEEGQMGLHSQMDFPETLEICEGGEEGEAKPFRFIKRNRVSDLFLILRNENTQMTALVLSFLDASTAAALMELYPQEKQLDIIQRISSLNEVNPRIMNSLEHILSEALAKYSSTIQYKIGGIHSAVEILNCCSSSVEKYVITTLDEQDPRLSESLKQNMFVFEDCLVLDREDLSMVFSRTERTDLLKALRMVDEGIKKEMLACFNEQERKEIEKQLKEMKRVRLTEVEAAQNKIINTIRTMEENGEIFVPRPDELV